MRQLRALMTFAICLTGVLSARAGPRLGVDERGKASPGAKPPWQRLLQGEDDRKAEQQDQRLGQLKRAGSFEDALKVAKYLAALRAQAEGADHWQAADVRWEAEALRRVLRQGAEVRNDYAGVLSLAAQAD